MSEVNDNKAQDALGDAADAAHGVVDETADAVSGIASRASDSASDAIRSATSAVNDALDTAQQNVSSGLRQATTAAGELSDKATGTVKKYPVRTLLIVAVGGIIAGIVLSRIASRR